MDFTYTPEEEGFRQELRDWLEEHLPESPPKRGQAGFDSARYTEFLIEWQRTLGKDGWAAIQWPKEYGGRGASIIEQAIYGEEMARHDAPQQVNVIGLGMCGPTIMTCGTEEQKRRYLSKLLSGEHLWCQGFSEPNAGSDVAALRTSAVEDGDAFILNGQKVWITFAQHCDYCLLLVRTNPDVPKHKGLSMLILDMKSEGVTVRPLTQLTGEAEFNEIFFDNVRVPKENLVGATDDGWRVAITTLMFERVNISTFVQAQRALDSVVALAQNTRRNGHTAAADPIIRQRLAQRAVELKALHLNELRALTRRARGETPGPEGSVAKLIQSQLIQAITALAMEIEGPASQIMPGSPHAVEEGAWQFPFLRSQASTIAGGTTAVMRNIIAERVLGLPKD